MAATPCALCGCNEAVPYLTGRDRLLRRSRRHTIVRCCHCGFRHLSPRPNCSQHEDLYPPDYPPYRQMFSKPSDVVDRAGWQWIKGLMDSCNLRRMGYAMERPSAAGWVVRYLSPLRRKKLRYDILPPHGRCRMLDVGCGTGFLLYKHKDLGWETWGVEMSPTAAEIARQAGLRVTTGQIGRVDLPQGHFDLIVMMHTLEHVDNPAHVLDRLRPLLASGGQVMIEVPNIDCLGLRIWGSYWFALDLPRHFSHFSIADLEHLATNTGYRIVRRLARPVAEWHGPSLDYWLEDRDWFPNRWQGRNLAERAHLAKWVRPMLALLARGYGREALRVWLAPVR